MTGPVWVARLRPAPGVSVDDLLAAPLGLDVWERGREHLLVAAPEPRLAELERRRLATVERLAERGDYEARMRER